MVQTDGVGSWMHALLKGAGPPVHCEDYSRVGGEPSVGPERPQELIRNELFRLEIQQGG